MNWLFGETEAGVLQGPQKELFLIAQVPKLDGRSIQANVTVFILCIT